MAQDDRASIASGDVDAVGGANRRGEDEVANAVETERFAARFAGRGFEARKDVLVVPKEIERVVVEQRRGNVGGEAVELPREIGRVRDVALFAGEADGEHGLPII